MKRKEGAGHGKRVGTVVRSPPFVGFGTATASGREAAGGPESWGGAGRLGLGVTGVLHVGTFGQEAFAAFLAAAGEAVTAVFGGHAGAEAVLVFEGALGGLEGAFGHGGTGLERIWRGQSGSVFHSGKDGLPRRCGPVS